MSEDIDSFEDSPEGPEEEENETAGMAWEGFTDQEILSQFAQISRAVLFAEQSEESYQSMLAEGLDPELGKVPFELYPQDKNVLALALHLVGFFSPILGERAKDLINRYHNANETVLGNYTDEEKEEIKRIFLVVREAWLEKAVASLEEEVGGGFEVYSLGAQDALGQGSWSDGQPREED